VGPVMPSVAALYMVATALWEVRRQGAADAMRQDRVAQDGGRCLQLPSLPDRHCRSHGGCWQIRAAKQGDLWRPR
jgi:hypothetical protein